MLNVNGCFTPLLGWLDHIIGEGLLKPKHRDLLLVADTVPDLLAKLAAWKPLEAVTKRADPEER